MLTSKINIICFKILRRKGQNFPTAVRPRPKTLTSTSKFFKNKFGVNPLKSDPRYIDESMACSSSKPKY